MPSHAPASIPTPQTKTVRRTLINAAAALFIALNKQIAAPYPLRKMM